MMSLDAPACPECGQIMVLPLGKPKARLRCINDPCPRAVAPDRQLPPEIERAVAANATRRELHKDIRAELRGNYGAWGLPKGELASILESEAELLRAEVEQERARARRKP